MEITKAKILAYQRKLESLGLSPSTIKRRMAAVRKFCFWAAEKGYLQENPFVKRHLGGVMASSAIWRIQPATVRGVFRFFAKIRQQVHRLPPLPTLSNIYEIYHSISITRYLHWAILIIFCAALGFGAYDQFFRRAPEPMAYPTALTPPKRYLSFQGRLTDSSGNPITSSTNMVFKLYNVSSGGTALWDSSSCTISPDTDGIFSLILGTTSGNGYSCPSATEIDASVFSENPEVWLEITVGTPPNDEVLEPRIQIATVGYALNAETLQGYPPASPAQVNTIPVVDSDGNIIIAAASPSIQSTSGTFGIKGQALTLTTATGSDGNITLAPDGAGVINFTLSAPTGNVLNATDAQLGASGQKEENTLFYGKVANDNTNFNLLKLESGSSPTPKFTIDYEGNASAAGNLRILGSGDNYFAGNVGIGVTAAGFALNVNGTIQVTGFKMPTGATAGYALVSDSEGVGTWQDITSGGSIGPWTLSGTNLYPDSTSYNVAIGATDALGYKLYVNGSSYLGGTLLVDSSNQRVGIGTTSPSYTLHVSGSTNDYLGYIYNSNTGSSAGGLYLRVDGNGDILTLNYSGTDVAKISGTQATFNVPTAFTSSGDVSIAYDLIFTNPTASYIKSQAPLYIIAGEPYNSSDLTLGTYNKGNVIVDSEALVTNYSATVSGQLVVGTSTAPANIGNFYLTNSATFGKALAILNQTESQDILTASASGTPKFTITNAGNIISAAGAKWMPISNSTTALNIANASGTSFVTFDTTNQRVGIGTTGPTQNLHISGNMRLTGALYDVNNEAGTSGQILSTTGTGVDWVDITSIGVGGSGTTNYLPKWISSSTLTNSVLYESSGNIGIGTTSPSYTLDVNGTINATTIRTPYQHTITVAKSGGDYTTITAALNSITDNDENNRYLIRVMPGIYNEAVTMKDYVDLMGAGIDATIITDNIFAANHSSVENLTIKITGAVSWKAGYDAYSLKAANPCYIRNAKVYMSSTTGPIYPLLTRTGSYMYAYNVIVEAYAYANSGDGLYAISHNAGGGEFWNSHIYLVLYGSGTHDDVGIVYTAWNSTTYLINSTVTIWNLASSNNTADRLFNARSNYRLIVRNSRIDYYTDYKTVKLAASDTGSGKMEIYDSTVYLSKDEAGDVYGFDDNIGMKAKNLYLTIEKTGTGGNVYGIKTSSSNTEILDSYFKLSNTGSGSTFGLQVNGASPTINNSTFQASISGGGSAYGAYIQTATCNPNLSHNTFSGTTKDVYIGTGCSPVMAFNRYSTIENNGTIKNVSADTSGNLNLSGNASASGSLFLAGSSPSINILNGSQLDIQTSVGGDAGLTPRLTVLNNGNIGIGTTSPDSKLEVAGTSWLRGATGTTGLFVNSSGNVGIGTTNPGSYALNVSGAGYFSGNLGVGGTASLSTLSLSGALFDKDNQPGTSGQILSSTGSGVDWIDIGSLGVGGSGTANYLPKWISSSTLGNSVLYETGENIGIGTTDPGTYKLYVAGDQYVSGNLTLGNNQILNKDGTATIIFSSTPSTSWNTLDAGAWQVSNTANVGQAALSVDQTMGGDIFTASASGTPKFVIKNDGNVGIGTTAPAARLHIASGSGFEMGFDNAAEIGARNAAGTMEGFLWPRWTDNVTYLNFGSGGFNIRNSASTSRVFITDGGNVGIGTTNPGAKLQTEVSINEAGLKTQNSPANRYVFIAPYLGGSGYNPLTQEGDSGIFYNDNYGLVIGPWTSTYYDGIRISSSGNVGIGTPSPGYTLDINGTLRATKSRTDPSSTSYYDSFLGSSNYVGVGTTAYIVGNYIWPKISISSGVTNDGYLMGQRINAVRNYTLDGDSGSLATIYGLYNFYGHYNSYSQTPSTTNVIGIYLYPMFRSGTITNLYDLYIASGLSGGTVTNRWAIYQTSNNAKNYFAGNVGIGTTSPTEKLTVSGNISFANYSGDKYIYFPEPGYTTGSIYRQAATNTMHITGVKLNAGAGLSIGSLGSFTYYVCSASSGSGNLGSCSSSRTYKHDIVYLASEDYERILEEIKNTNVATFKVNSDPNNLTHVGIIAEESPSQLQYIDEKGNINLNFLSAQLGYTWAGIKALANHVDKLEETVKNNEVNTLKIITKDIEATGSSSLVGNVGIGTTNPGTKLAVYGLTGTSSYNYLRVDTSTGNFYYDSSSQRYKENIRLFEDDFSKILNLEPKIYLDKTSGLEEIGFLAEDLDNLGLKHLVTYNKDGLPEAIKYERIPLYLLGVIKTQQAQIANLSTELNNIYFNQTGNLEIISPEENYEEPLAKELIESQISNLKSQIYNLKLESGEIVERIGNFAQATIAKLKAGLIETTNLIAKKAVVEEKIISPKVETEEATTQRIKLSEIAPLSESGDIVISLENQTSSNSNNSSASSSFGKLIVKGKEGKEAASIDASGNATFSGVVTSEQLSVISEATIGATLYADKVVAREIIGLKGTFGELLTATVSAEKIQGLEERLAQLEEKLKTSETTPTPSPTPTPEITPDEAESSPTPSPTPAIIPSEEATNPTPTPTPEFAPQPEQTLAILDALDSSEDASASTSGEEASSTAELSPEEIEQMVNEILASAASPASESADLSVYSHLAIQGNLTVLGTATLADAFVINSINIGGNLVLEKDAINTFFGPLYIQNLGLGGVDILAGKITIDEHGNAVFGGDVEIRGRLATKEISPLEGQDLVINLANLPTVEESISEALEGLPSSIASQASTLVDSGFGKLLIKGINNEIVASIDASGSALFAGDLVASGSGTFEKLIIASREASQSGEIIPGVWVTNASAGTAVLPAGNRETIIYSPAVKEESLVYLTPLSSTQNNVLYVKAKKATSGECKLETTPDSTSLKDCGWFKVGVDTPLSQEVKFNWWIIELRL